MSVVYLADARVRRLLGRLGALYEKRDAAEQRVADLAQKIDETLLELDDAKKQLLPLPVPVAVGGAR